MDNIDCLKLAAITYGRPIIALNCSTAYSTLFLPLNLPVSQYKDLPIGIWYDGSIHYKMLPLSQLPENQLILPGLDHLAVHWMRTNKIWRKELLTWLKNSSLSKFKFSSLD